MKDYYYEDLEALSRTAREVWLADQCSSFETEILKLARDRERDHFVEELYRKLKQLTRRWQSWNHRSFGGVISRGYVAELAAWERTVHLRGIFTPKTQSNSPESNVLQRFDEFCGTFEDLLQRFEKGIFQPLCDFFQGGGELVPQLQGVSKDLERVLNQWRLLLTSGVIDGKLFSSASAEANHPLGIRHRIHDFDLVLRLIPDLTEKAYEALRLARRWRLIGKTSAVHREETYVVSRETSRRQQRRASKVLKKVNSLEEILEQSKAQCATLEKELENSNARCEELEKEVTLHRQKCNQLENELDTVKKRCKSLKEKLDNAKKDTQSDSNEAESSQEYCRVLQKELNNARLRYCAQKIKFINAKKRCALLTGELESTREQLTQLESELEAKKRGCQALQVKLENSKKNIVTQGNMLDVLQNQCYTLKEELDETKMKSLELTSQLEKSQERCSTLEKELEFVKIQFQKLEIELRRAKTREELLVQQNTHLRTLVHERGLEVPSVVKINLHTPDTGFP